MTTTNEVIREIIANYPEYKFSFRKINEDIILIFNTKTVYMKRNDTVEMVKNKIAARNKGDNTCGICYETSPMMACCGECSNRICIVCNLTIHIHNLGIHKCSFCRYTAGSIQSPKEIYTHIISIVSQITDLEFRNEVMIKIDKNIIF